MYNSTIRAKMGICELCPVSRGRQPLTKGMCQNHYWEQNRMKSAQRFSQKEVDQEEGLPELIEEADAVFSRYVRLSAADDKGILNCFICGSPVHYKRAQAMHFISRACMFLRWDVRNVYPGDMQCNELKGGNLILFAKQLNIHQPGIVDILMEEGRLIHKATREEVRQIIGEYSSKIKLIA